LVRLKVDVIVSGAGELVILAAKQATSTIPIIMAVSADLVGTGLVVSLARPGGNITGLSIQAAELSGKRLDLPKQAVPQVSRMAGQGAKSEHMTLVHLRLQSLAKSLLPPFVKGGSAKREGICHSRSCAPMLCGVI
jgi:putative ABC transport system substrate-binding protein